MEASEERYVVSACLAGARTRYDGTAATSAFVERLVREGRALPVCPEQLGGFSTPRFPMEISGGNGSDVLDGEAGVFTREGHDVTERFTRGAFEAAGLAALYGANRAILKSRSPSCGCGLVNDGSFTGRLAEGDGVFAALLKRSGIDVRTEEDIDG